MKILVVDCNVRYMNPMRNLMPYYLSSVGEVTFYGPGYATSEQLSAGLARFVEENGPYDALVRTVLAVPEDITDEVSSTWSDSKLKLYKKGFHFCNFVDQDLLSFWQDKTLHTHVCDYNVSLMHQFDFQVMSRKFANYLRENFQLVVGLSKDFWESRVYGDIEICDSYEHSNHWYDFIDESPDKVVGLTNFVAPNEFNYVPLSNRPNPWSVAGTSYASRKIAKQVLKDNGVVLDDGRNFAYKSLVIQNKLGLNPYSKRGNLDKLNALFHSVLINSKYSYTCGSELRMPIRKFFEIPAAGAVLVCKPCVGFERLGFKNQHNAITCEPEDLIDLSEHLSKNPDMAQSIASEGQRLIQQKHTVDVRARQLKSVIEKAVKGDYNGSYWESGDLVFV